MKAEAERRPGFAPGEGITPTAADRRVRVDVELENAFGNGGVDRVTVVDTIAGLVARGRLDPREAEAAARYQRAYDRVIMVLGNNGDQAAIDGGDGDLAPDRRLDAARDLMQADRALGAFAWVVRFVVGEGGSLEDVARRLSDPPGRAERSGASTLLRQSLKVLADLWVPIARRPAIADAHAADYRPTPGGDPKATIGGVAHCTAHRVFR